ncbi:protein tyrosine phosphatase [Asticcacaulis sp. EMRT-3]|uniref:fused DSP-PTPase phosphatase/NAD kinase-like protein n=1 Tax=Asticcacaulis sp. EMRT-3 TaxID=3040349 RepID=UPI0024AEC534|nr:protein tyrosine phosphatase [Asticcacaulis sp. EMRT-3]MDI7774089.1 protein tyrosine phosphatase [Asticcacaulis sp. EMRT-3]
MKLLKKKVHNRPFRTDTPWTLFTTYLHYLWADHAYLRLGFTNAHWIGTQMVRTNQPWPFQLKWWRDHGVRTVINLRGGKGSFYYLEKYACDRLGITLEDFGLTSRSLPTAAEILAAKALFERIAYPALLHCKSGADRAGMMSVLYRHLHLGEPIREAAKELGLRTLHMKAGMTGVLDYLFEVYLRDIEPQGISFLDWVTGPDYDPERLKADFKASWWGRLVTDRLLQRE